MSLGHSTQWCNQSRHLVAHIIHRFDYGGLENGLVNLVNELSDNRLMHAIIALTGISNFRQRITRHNVQIYDLGKNPGKDPSAYWRLLKLLRELRPSIVHTRNIGTLDCVAIACLAGVRIRVHGEHGWDVHDPDGTNYRYILIRRFLNPLITRFVTVSSDLENWLIKRCGIDNSKIIRICNGVDTNRFRPRETSNHFTLPVDRFPPGSIVVGSVTRFNTIKDPLNLVVAFLKARSQLQQMGTDLRLLMIGDGPLRVEAEAIIHTNGQSHATWFPGSRDDIAEMMRWMDIFALGSLREGISNTVLEAMSSGLPVIATATGGNFELIQPGITGKLVRPGDPDALADAISFYARDVEARTVCGSAARARAEQNYSLRRMIDEYEKLYTHLCSSGKETA